VLGEEPLELCEVLQVGLADEGVGESSEFVGRTKTRRAFLRRGLACGMG
jgi:hypothetical protein